MRRMSQALDDVRRSLTRRVAVLRVSRLSGLITLVAALVLTVVWWNDPLPLGGFLSGSSSVVACFSSSGS